MTSNSPDRVPNAEESTGHRSVYAIVRRAAIWGLLLILHVRLFQNERVMAQVSPGSLPGISLVWSHSVGGLRSLDISPHAKRLALITEEGKLALWNAQDGTPVWSVSKQTDSQVLVNDGSGFVATFVPHSRVGRKLTVRLAKTGAVAWQKTYPSSIWAASLSPTGTSLVVGSGDDTLSIVDLSGEQATTTSTLIGVATSVVFEPDGSKFFVSHWDRSGISCYDDDGTNLWNASGEMDRTYTISHIGPKFLTYVGSSNRQGKSPVAYVVRNENGTLLWAYSFVNKEQSAFAVTTDTADMTAISYAQTQQASSGSVLEQKLTAVDRSGQVEWTKGGLFWAPTLICITPDQTGIVVYDGERTLYRLDSEGRTVAKAFLSDVLKKWSVSLDDSSLVVYTHDGQLSLLHIQ